MLSKSLAPDLPPALPAERRASPAAPGLRLVTVPDAAPPYDCETHDAACQPTRAATRGGRSRPSRQAANVRAPAPRETAQRETAQRETAQRKASPPGGSPGAAGMTAAWQAQLARVIVETLAGSRPRRQLIPMTTESARTKLGLLATYLASDRPPKITRIVASRPSEHVVEMTVIVSCGARSRALAMRLEHMPGRPATPGLPARPARWLCTEVETG